MSWKDVFFVVVGNLLLNVFGDKSSAIEAANKCGGKVYQGGKIIYE